MNDGVLVKTEGLGKSYPLVFRPRDRFHALRHLLSGRGEIASVPVLQDVSVSVRRGESLGLIGENGAGKSTLLKLLTGVLTPTEGKVQVNGRVGALLELGAGFHPEYTGRDNIALSAALYGLDAAETRARLPEIIEFADIGRYIDEPVKHYSSGMIVRLGFSVIAALKPDLLITDEILAVGDESFQKKCVRWIESYLESGGTLILVSHSMYHVQKLCHQACWIKQGKVEVSGEVFAVTQAYLAYQESKSARETQAEQRADVQGQNLEFYLLDLALNGNRDDVATVVEYGQDLDVHVRIHSREGRAPIVVFGIVRADGTPIYGIGSDMDEVEAVRESENVYTMHIRFENMSLLPGAYVIKAHPLDTEGVRLFDTIERGLTVRGQSREFGLVRLPHSWNVDSGNAGLATVPK